MNILKCLLCSGMILATTVSSYYPVYVNGRDVEQFTITPDTNGAVFTIPADGTGKVSCRLPSEETPRPIYTMAPDAEAGTAARASAGIYYSESPEEGDEEEDPSWQLLASLGEVDTANGILTVTITLPEEFCRGTSQAALDAVTGIAFQAATRNKDGTVTYRMTKAQYKALNEDIAATFDAALQKMAESLPRAQEAPEE